MATDNLPADAQQGDDSAPPVECSSAASSDDERELCAAISVSLREAAQMPVKREVLGNRGTRFANEDLIPDERDTLDNDRFLATECHSPAGLETLDNDTCLATDCQSPDGRETSDNLTCFATEQSTNVPELVTATESQAPAMHCVLAQLWHSDLSTDIAADILRGVSIGKVLAGLGRAFSGNVGCQTEYMESAPVTRLDDFISHDWASKRAGKLVALCIVHNSTGAIVVSFCVGVVLAGLQSQSVVGVLPYPRPAQVDHIVGGWGCWCQCVCPVVFVYVLLFWQNLRLKFGRKPKQVFLDKLCVDQVNPQRKAAAILGLAGFLNNTDRLVICWTERYFTRLWCVYEIASWLHLRKPFDKVVFMPLALAKAMIALFTVQAFACIAYALGQYFVGFSEICFLIVVFIIGPWYTHLFRGMVHDLRNLPQQLKNFSISTAKCYCCSVDHKIPGTDEELQCDRQVVCRTVKKWFPKKVMVDYPCRSTSSGQSGYLDSMRTATSVTHFDQRVRELFGPFILQRTGPTQIRYKYCLLIAQPYLWRLLDVTVCYGQWDVSLQVKLSKALEYLVCVFCIIPFTVKVALWYFTWLDRTIGIRRSRVLDAFLSTILFIPQGAFLVACNIPMATSLDQRLWTRFFGICAAFTIFTLLFFTNVRAMFRMRGEQSEEVVEDKA